VPPGVRLVRVDAETGLLPGPGSGTVILEAFMPGTEPTTVSTGRTASIDGAPGDGGRAGAPSPQTGGLY
jgi:penicillin-binding protein 1A